MKKGMELQSPSQWVVTTNGIVHLGGEGGAPLCGRVPAGHRAVPYLVAGGRGKRRWGRGTIPAPTCHWCLRQAGQTSVVLYIWRGRHPKTRQKGLMGQLWVNPQFRLVSDHIQLHTRVPRRLRRLLAEPLRQVGVRDFHQVYVAVAPHPTRVREKRGRRPHQTQLRITQEQLKEVVKELLGGSTAGP